MNCFVGLLLLALLANLHAAPVVPDTSAWSAVFWNLTGVWTSDIREPEEYFPADEGFIDMRPTKMTNTAVKPATRRLLGLEQRSHKDEITGNVVGNSLLQKIRNLLSSLSDSRLFRIQNKQKKYINLPISRKVRRSATRPSGSKSSGNYPPTDTKSKKSSIQMQSDSTKLQEITPKVTVESRVKIKEHKSSENFRNSNEKSSNSAESKEVFSSKMKSQRLISQTTNIVTRPKITTTPLPKSNGKQEPSSKKPQPIQQSVTTKITTTSQKPTTADQQRTKKSNKAKDKLLKLCKDPDDPEGSGDGSSECSGSSESSESTEVVPMKILHDSE